MLSTTSRTTRVLAAGAKAVVLACNGDNLVLPTEGDAAKITILSGDGQTGAAGAALDEPVVVHVTDGLDRPVVDQRVVFSFPAGVTTGQVIPDTIETDSDGRA